MKRRWIWVVVVLVLFALVLVACRDNSADAMTFEEYNAMTEEEQHAFYSSFADPQDFFAWYNEAKNAYLAKNATISESNVTVHVGEGKK